MEKSTLNVLFYSSSNIHHRQGVFSVGDNLSEGKTSLFVLEKEKEEEKLTVHSNIHRRQGVLDVGFDVPLAEAPLDLKLKG